MTKTKQNSYWFNKIFEIPRIVYMLVKNLIINWCLFSSGNLELFLKGQQEQNDDMEIPFDLGVVVNVDGEEGPLNGQYLVLFYLPYNWAKQLTTLILYKTYNIVLRKWLKDKIRQDTDRSMVPLLHQH